MPRIPKVLTLTHGCPVHIGDRVEFLNGEDKRVVGTIVYLTDVDVYIEDNAGVHWVYGPEDSALKPA